MSNYVRIALTLDPELLAQVDAYRPVLARQSPGVSANRSVAIRTLLHKGLEAARAEPMDASPSRPDPTDQRPKGRCPICGVRAGCPAYHPKGHERCSSYRPTGA